MCLLKGSLLRLVTLPERLPLLDSVPLPRVGLVGEAREAEHRLIPATKDAPVHLLLVRRPPVLGHVEPDVDVARWQDERPGDAVVVHRGDLTQVVAHDEFVGQDCSNVYRLLPPSCRMP
jgi:hypothetical protein